MSPVPLILEFEDGTSEEHLLPAEIWVRNAQMAEKVFVVDKPVAWVEIDRHQQIADTEVANNRWPQQIEESLLTVTTDTESGNPLRTYLREQARAKGTAAVEAFAVPSCAWSQALEAGAITPESARETLMGLPELASLNDPWDRPFVIELSDNKEAYAELADGTKTNDEVVLVVIRSAGDDGEPNTSDDLILAHLRGWSGEAITSAVTQGSSRVTAFLAVPRLCTLDDRSIAGLHRLVYAPRGGAWRLEWVSK